MSGQRKLTQSQVAEFYHDIFVRSQVVDFTHLCFPVLQHNKTVVDVGGGCGFFASALSRELGLAVRVVDADPVSVEVARKSGVEAVLGDALQLHPGGDEAAACFNLILHHLVGNTDDETASLQMRAVNRWGDSGAVVFVNEYIYDSYIFGFSGWLIYKVTSSRLLSAIASLVSRFVPSLRANTFGIGVRFRGCEEWRAMFQKEGWQISGYVRGVDEHLPFLLRLLLIRSCRRDSFVLVRGK